MGKTSVCVNAYPLLDSSTLKWNVRVYDVRRADGLELSQSDRSSLKDAAFELRREHSALCRGWGFVLDVDVRTVVLPGSWQVPTKSESKGLIFELRDQFEARANVDEHDRITGGIIREGIKKHIKNSQSVEIGPLWQDFNRFCQHPKFSPARRFEFCRSFSASAKRLADGQWAVVIPIGTSVIDGYSIADYFSRNQSVELALALDWRQSSLSRRDSSPADVRAYVRNSDGRIIALADVRGLQEMCARNSSDSAKQEIVCAEFKRPSELIRASQLHLIVDSHQTEELHSETIIEPNDRIAMAGTVVKHLNTAEVFGCELKIDDRPWDATTRSTLIRPPAIRVKASRGTAILKCKEPLGPQALRDRGKKRIEHITKYGFLSTRPMRPFVGVHESLGAERARRLQVDLMEILRLHGIGNVTFDYALYSDVAALKRLVEQGNYDSLLAVLPTRNDQADDTHDRIKRLIGVPSQCMQARNVMPAHWATRPIADFLRQEPVTARRLQNRLHAVVLNLLVKHNWVPFVPAEPFHYNVHVGIDVGGLHNTHAMACVGYGFADASSDLVFQLGEIPIRGQKKEPIPSTDLLNGLTDIFESIATVLIDAGIKPNFSRVLFYRDGPLLGRGDAWNEVEALQRLSQVFTERQWTDGPLCWTALEVMKEAEGLRVFELEGEAQNATVGRCTFATADPNTALVNSTGRPYLSQGTSSPLKVHMVDVVGQADFHNALTDLVWQCDLGFTKPDIGFSLPWVLHVAGVGALQIARAYKVTGIAA
jgi:hypothetical protein